LHAPAPRGKTTADLGPTGFVSSSFRYAAVEPTLAKAFSIGSNSPGRDISGIASRETASGRPNAMVSRITNPTSGSAAWTGWGAVKIEYEAPLL
jgi:hypothetical protein